MTIESERNGGEATLLLEGRLDTATAPLLERKLKQWNDISELVLDLGKVSYVSSAGLRVLLQTQKAMKAQKKKFCVRGINDDIRSVFEITGFIGIMTEEERFVLIRKEEPGRIILSLNGEMGAEDAESLIREIARIQKERRSSADPAEVLIDAEQLAFRDAEAERTLKQAVGKCAEEHKSLSIQWK